MSDPCAKLNAARRAAATFGAAGVDGRWCSPPLLVIAGAGTGKTTTLAHRVAHLCMHRVSSDRILFMLDVERQTLGAHRSRDRFPQKATCLDIYSRTVNAQCDLADTLSASFPHFAQWHDELKALFAAYVERKLKQQTLDYDDLLLYWYYLVEDERIAADVENILDFPAHYAGAQVITLEGNYRSTQEILDTSNVLMGEASRSYRKALRPPPSATRHSRRRTGRSAVPMRADPGTPPWPCFPGCSGSRAPTAVKQ